MQSVSQEQVVGDRIGNASTASSNVWAMTVSGKAFQLR